MSGGSYTTFGLSARYRGRIHPFLLTITEHNAPGMEYRKCEVCGTQRNLLLFYSRLRQGRDGPTRHLHHQRGAVCRHADRRSPLGPLGD